MPSVHQSTAEVCPQPLMTSGAMYSVDGQYPQGTARVGRTLRADKRVRAKVGDAGARVDQDGLGSSDYIRWITSEPTPFGPLCLIPAGAPPGSPDCLDRSKSESMMWPDWCSRMS